MYTKVVDVIGTDTDPSLSSVIFVVFEAQQATAEPCMHGRSIGDEIFLRGHPEHGAVCEEGLCICVRGIPPVRRVCGWVPGVKVRIEVHNTDRLSVDLTQ